MKHDHNADVNINVNIPKQDVEELIDKTKDAAISIIMTVTAAQIVKAIFNSRSS